MTTKTTVDVTIDGRILITQGRNTIELVSAAETTQVVDAIREAERVQAEINGEHYPEAFA